MQTKTLPTCREIISYLATTGMSYADIAKQVGCHCSTIVRIKDNHVEAPRLRVVDGLYKLYVRRLSELAPLTKKVEEWGL